MALKPVSPERLQELSIKNPSLLQQAGGVLGQFGEGIKDTLSSVAGLPGYLQSLAPAELKQMQANNFGGNKEAGYLPTPQDIRSKISGREPEGFLEKTARNIGGGAPITAAAIGLGGAPLIPSIVSNIGGSLGSATAEEAGLGPIGQFFGGIAGGAGLNKLYNAVRRGVDPRRLGELAKNAQKKFYDNAEKISLQEGQPATLRTEISGDATKFRSGLYKLEDKIRASKALTQAQKAELSNKISLLDSDIKMNKVSGQKLFESRVELNSLYDAFKGHTDKQARRSLDDIVSLVRKEIEAVGQSSPLAKRWYENIKSGDDVTKALNYRPKLQRLIEDSPDIPKILTNKLAKEAVGIGLGAKYGGVPGALLGFGGGQVLKKGTQLSGFAQSSTGRKLLGEAFKNTIEDNIPNLTRTYHKINRAAEEYSKKYPQENAEPKLKRVSPGRLQELMSQQS